MKNYRKVKRFHDQVFDELYQYDEILFQLRCHDASSIETVGSSIQMKTPSFLSRDDWYLGYVDDNNKTQQDKAVETLQQLIHERIYSSQTSNSNVHVNRKYNSLNESSVNVPKHKSVAFTIPTSNQSVSNKQSSQSYLTSNEMEYHKIIHHIKYLYQDAFSIADTQTSSEIDGKEGNEDEIRESGFIDNPSISDISEKVISLLNSNFLYVSEVKKIMSSYRELLGYSNNTVSSSNINEQDIQILRNIYNILKENFK